MMMMMMMMMMMAWMPKGTTLLLWCEVWHCQASLRCQDCRSNVTWSSVSIDFPWGNCCIVLLWSTALDHNVGAGKVQISGPQMWDEMGWGGRVTWDSVETMISWLVLVAVFDCRISQNSGFSDEVHETQNDQQANLSHPAMHQKRIPSASRLLQNAAWLIYPCHPVEKFIFHVEFQSSAPGPIPKRQAVLQDKPLKQPRPPTSGRRVSMSHWKLDDPYHNKIHHWHPFL